MIVVLRCSDFPACPLGTQSGLEKCAGVSIDLSDHDEYRWLRKTLVLLIQKKNKCVGLFSKSLLLPECKNIKLLFFFCVAKQQSIIPVLKKENYRSTMHL